MQKLSQTEELARTLAAHARRKTLTPDQISRAMDEADYDVARLDELYEALEARGVHIAEDEEAELPPLDETQLGQLEHELSAEGVALDDPVHTLSLIHISCRAKTDTGPARRWGHSPARTGRWSCRPGRAAASRHGPAGPPPQWS